MASNTLLSQLRTLYKSNELAKRVFSLLATRQVRPSSDLRRIRAALIHAHKEMIEPRDILDVFTFLEHLGLGKLEINDYPTPSRFHWKYNCKRVALAAVGKEDGAADWSHPLKQLPASNAFQRDGIHSTVAANNAGVHFVFSLRSGRKLTLVLPVDLSNDERDDLADCILGLKELSLPTHKPQAPALAKRRA